MQINPITARKLYKTTASSGAVPGLATEGYKSESATKMDTISISAQGSTQRAFGGLVRSIASDIQALDDPARVESLRKAVSEGTYHVSADALAGAILSHVFAE